MRKNQGVELVLKPINMHGGGYSNFLQVIKSGLRPTALLRIATVLLRKSGRLASQYAADDKLDKVLENPQVIKTPVVRNGKQSPLGYLPDVWKNWN